MSKCYFMFNWQLFKSHSLFSSIFFCADRSESLFESLLSIEHGAVWWWLSIGWAAAGQLHHDFSVSCLVDTQPPFCYSMVIWLKHFFTKASIFSIMGRNSRIVFFFYHCLPNKAHITNCVTSFLVQFWSFFFFYSSDCFTNTKIGANFHFFCH